MNTRKRTIDPLGTGIIGYEKDGTPLVAVLVEPEWKGVVTVRSWCEGCGGWHRHGRPAPGTDETPYRVADCWDPKSPLYGKGHYRLVEVGKMEEPGTRPVR